MPVAFGFKAPPKGYLTEGSRTYGLYAADLEELGSWAPKIARLSATTRFQVLLDRNRARVYGYHDLLKNYVPFLWVDRFGHWVSFRWQQSLWSGVKVFTVEATNASGKGVQVSWADHGTSAEVVDLLRADFIGISAPSRLVRGYPGSSERLPSSVDALSSIPVPVAAGGPVGRPTQVLLGAAGSLPVPSYLSGLPKAPTAPPTPHREWVFNYSDPNLAEVSAIQDPMGVKTTFTYLTYRFPHSTPILRGVSEAVSVDGGTGAAYSQTWSRSVPASPGESWTVTHASGYSDGQPTEDRATTYAYIDTGAAPVNAILKSIQIRGTSGNTQTTTYEPSTESTDGPAWSGRIHIEATGRPEIDIIRKTETVAVTILQVKSANPFGHAAIALGDNPAFGLVPNSDAEAFRAGALEVASRVGLHYPLGISVPGHIEGLPPGRQIEATMTLRVTPEQARTMAVYINQVASQPQDYDPSSQNCATFVVNVLKAGGIKVPPASTPKELIDILRKSTDKK